jgi:hypothetical protein
MKEHADRERSGHTTDQIEHRSEDEREDDLGDRVTRDLSEDEVDPVQKAEEQRGEKPYLHLGQSASTKGDKGETARKQLLGEPDEQD